MGEEAKDGTKTYYAQANQAGQLGNESHIIYELKQRREYLFNQLSIIQRAIEAVNLANNC
jgi:hypothetical protein